MGNSSKQVVIVVREIGRDEAGRGIYAGLQPGDCR